MQVYPLAILQTATADGTDWDLAGFPRFVLFFWFRDFMEPGTLGSGFFFLFFASPVDLQDVTLIHIFHFLFITNLFVFILLSFFLSSPIHLTVYCFHSGFDSYSEIR